jgi:hypothetical protein
VSQLSKQNEAGGLKKMVILRLNATNGEVQDGSKRKTLEQVLNELEQQGFNLLSHKITFWEPENMLIEVVLMQKET